MARARRKKKKNIKFELSVWGLLGVATVCFCIFLWMFLLGVWAGQTILLPGESGSLSVPDHKGVYSVASRQPGPAVNEQQHGA